MPTNVIMPQMGESIAEGTITKWLKKVGERVERDEPLFEISTDKGDAEIPAPAAAMIGDILYREYGKEPADGAHAVIVGGGWDAGSGGEEGAQSGDKLACTIPVSHAH